MKVVMCAAEMVPFSKVGGLADVLGALPVALEKQGCQVVVVVPGYKDEGSAGIKIESLSPDISVANIGKATKVYFVESKKFFDRDGIYGDLDQDYEDNLDRFLYFSRRTIALLKEIDFSPEILHLHDWHTCLVAILLKELYARERFFKQTKTVLTIHNVVYQGQFSKQEFPKLGLPSRLLGPEGLEFYGRLNLLKGGIEYCDAISTVSPTYSREIQTEEYGAGLAGVLKKHRSSLIGILNGVDYSIWDPKSDKYIASNYLSDNLEGKSKDKEDLQRACGFNIRADLALFGMVTRLTEQKGIDLLIKAIDQICGMNLQLVVLGMPDTKFYPVLEGLAKRYPGKFCLRPGFDNPLAHKVYAGSDLFLMPSKYEPCGLSQLISFRYGTLPLVFKTGGLADTVSPENGFVFDRYDQQGLVESLQRAISAYADKPRWDRLVKKVMKYDFSWDEAARQYLELYERVQKS